MGRRDTDQNRATDGRMRDLCGTTSLVNTAPSGYRALLSEAYHTTPATVAGWAIAPTLNLSQNTDTGEDCRPKVFVDNGLSDHPPAVYTDESFLV